MVIQEIYDSPEYPALRGLSDHLNYTALDTQDKSVRFLFVVSQQDLDNPDLLITPSVESRVRYVPLGKRIPFTHKTHIYVSDIAAQGLDPDNLPFYLRNAMSLVYTRKSV